MVAERSGRLLVVSWRFQVAGCRLLPDFVVDDQDVEIGEAQGVRCLTRGLWLGERDGVRFAVLLDVRDGHRGVRARLEIAVGPGEIPARAACGLRRASRRRRLGGLDGQARLLSRS